MTNIDFSKVVLAEDKRELSALSRAEAAKRECKMRILQHMSLEAQQNIAQAMTAYAVGAANGVEPSEALSEAGLTEDDIALARTARKWLTAMQAACRRLSSDDLATDVTADAVWPAFPQELAALVNRF